MDYIFCQFCLVVTYGQMTNIRIKRRIKFCKLRTIQSPGLSNELINREEIIDARSWSRMRVWSWMYETGPQVLSPVRKPNQVDTVTWDVTRDFYTRWRAFTVYSFLPDPLSPYPSVLPFSNLPSYQFKQGVQSIVGDRLIGNLFPLRKLVEELPK